MTDETRPPADDNSQDSHRGSEGVSSPPSVESPPPSSLPSVPAAPGYAPAGAGMVSDPWGGWFGRLLMPAVEAKGWLRFLGVVAIASGVLAVLSIFGILFAWLYIWVGVLLWQAADRATQAAQTRDPSMLEQYLQKMKTVVLIAGVATAVSIVVSIFTFILAITLGWAATWIDMMNF